jgi:hypothetical protein
MLIYSSTNGAVAYLTKRIFDDIFANKDETTLLLLPFAIIGLFAIRGVVFFIEANSPRSSAVASWPTCVTSSTITFNPFHCRFFIATPPEF